MSNRIGVDYGRRYLDFKTPKVVEVLPEHFLGDYPKLVALLDAYHDFMDSDGNVNDSLRQLLKVRDVDGVSLQFLEYLLQEIGNGISSDKFTDPREVARNFPDFYRIKGSNFSAKSFFRALYGEEVEISYPKDNVFIVNESLIGAESLRYIQNGALYQTLSILIKSSRPISQWRDLYKRYVHPAGFYLGGEVLAEGVVDLALNIMPGAIPDSDASAIQIFGVADLILEGVYEPLMGFIQSYDSAPVVARNTLTYTEEFNNAVWGKTNMTVTANAAIAPDGTMTADLIVPTAANTSHWVSRNYARVGGEVETLSCYMKSAGTTFGKVQFGGTAPQEVADFNLLTGTVAFTGSGAVASIESVGNGWYRCIVTGTWGVSAAPLFSAPTGAAIGTTFLGDGVNGIYIWGAQLEPGTAVSNYQRVVAANDVYETVGPNYVQNTYHVDLTRTIAGIWEDSATSVDSNYGSIINAATANTVGFDDSHYDGIDFANVFETMDRSVTDSAGSNIWTL